MAGMAERAWSRGIACAGTQVCVSQKFTGTLMDLDLCRRRVDSKTVTQTQCRDPRDSASNPKM